MKKRISHIGTFLIFCSILIGVNNCSKLEDSKELRNELNKPKIIREYVDLDKNGGYDSYRLTNQYKGGREEIIPDLLGREIRSFRFYAPFGGKGIEEAPRELLENMFRLYNYPDVDEIRFSERD